MAVTAVEVYERLRDKLGAEEASLLVRYVEESVERRIERTFYVLLAAMIVLNGDKVLAVLNALLRLVH